MDIKEFIANFADQFEDTDATVFNPETKFRELEEWSSMTTLGIISMADEEYGVELSAQDLQSAITVQDLYNVIKSKRG